MSIKNRDLVAVGALLVLYFGNMFVLSIFETIGLPLTMDEFSWSPADVRSVTLPSIERLLSRNMFWGSLPGTHFLCGACLSCACVVSTDQCVIQISGSPPTLHLSISDRRTSITE